MSAQKRHLPNKKLPPSQLDQQIDYETQEDIDPQSICLNENQTVQISSAEAELYFEFLRKKISHQAKDPFSLPFLNLKFQQLESSWKGATEQLNLESRIYGMRVDNCHDNTIKMLNYVIRNQQDQIRKDTLNVQKQIKREEDRQQKSTPNYHLDNPEKHILTTKTLDKLENMSLWNVIFKKSQTLNQIQLNTIELSNNLSLQLDLKSVNYRPKKTDSNDHLNPTTMQVESNMFQSYPYINQELGIYREIQALRKEVMQELYEVQAKRKDRQKISDDQKIQNPLWEMNLGIRDIDFSEFCQDFDQFQRYHQQEDDSQSEQNNIFQPNFEPEPRERIFTPRMHELHSMQIDPIREESNQDQSDEEENGLENELYQPQRDFLFNSTYKKQKRVENRKLGKVKRTNNTNIDFGHAQMILDRKKAFKNKRINRAHRKNNNLVPINYVVIYEGRNPFKKIKKGAKNRVKADIYDPNNNSLQPQLQQPFKRFETMKDQLIFGSLIQDNHQKDKTFEQNESQQENIQESEQKWNYMKHVPMKKVKQEIIRELKNSDESRLISRQSMMASKPLNVNDSFQESSKLDETSYMDTYLQEEACMIGLKFFKEKMKTYDPLDILVTMLHVAFEEQVILQPLYMHNQEQDGQSDMVLKDILIPMGHLI